MKGCLMITEEGLSVVVVEGGPKAQKRYSKVLLQRIDWAAGIEDADAEPPPPGPGDKYHADSAILIHLRCRRE